MKRVKNRKKICIVPNCMRRSTLGNELSFHSFPRRGTSLVEITTKLGMKEKVDRHLEWLKRLRILHHRPDMFVCSQHFAPTDYYLPHIPVKTRVLKSTAVPSRNLPESSTEQKVLTTMEEKSLRRMERCCRQKQNLKNNRKSSEISANDLINVSGSSALFAGPLLQKSPNKKKTEFEERLFPLHKDCTMELQEHRKALPVENERPFELNTTNTRFGHNNIFIASLLQRNDALVEMCGIQSHAALNGIISLMKKYYPISESVLLSLKERIILTTMKLQTNITFAGLAAIFECPDALFCRRIFIDTLNKLSNIMRSMLQWWSNEKVHGKVPKIIRSCEKTVVVLKCLEFKVEKPNCSQCQRKTFSTEKLEFTAKFMTGITPAGSLIYVSDIYGGKISNTNLFKQSGVINRLNRGDAIIIDDDLEIETICKKRGVQLVRTVNREILLSQRELLFNCELATASIHIHQINRNIRKFAILSNRISKVLIPCLQDIVLVCCALVSLSEPAFSIHDLT